MCVRARGVDHLPGEQPDPRVEVGRGHGVEASLLEPDVEPAAPVGTLDDPSVFEGPQMAIYTCDAQKYHAVPTDIPTFEKMFKDFGAGSLPAPTAILIKISHGFVGNIHCIILLSITAAMGFTAFSSVALP